MTRKLASISGLLPLTVALAACGGAAADEQSRPTGDGGSVREDSAKPAPSSGESRPAAQSRQPNPGVRLKTQRSDYGTILVTASGRTVYLFDKEQRAKSECYGDCATAWPPLLARGNPIARGGARQGLLGTTRRKSGKAQVTYAGHPLYLYAPEQPGEILCQNVLEFGGYWLIVRPSGTPIR